jgi:hypothetical protein
MLTCGSALVGELLHCFYSCSSLVGSCFNIPVTELNGPSVRIGQIVDFYGMRYVVPLVTSWPGTIVALNAGGAVMPHAYVGLLLGNNRPSRISTVFLLRFGYCRHRGLPFDLFQNIFRLCYGSVLIADRQIAKRIISFAFGEFASFKRCYLRPCIGQL